MSKLGDIALSYLGRGWCVIPAQQNGKKPLIEWSQYADRLPTPDEVKAWWKQWPNANIALITGRVSGLVAVDVDVDRGGRPEPVYERNRTGVVSKTGGGGFHLLYRYPPKAERVYNRVGKDGIDIRGDGGYVIVPPSVHPNGTNYEWTAQGELGECPTFVLEHPDKDGEQQDQKWLTELLSGEARGGRNDACARLAGYFASKEMAREVALTLVLQWNTLNTPPLPIPEIERTVESVYKGAFRRQAHKKATNTKKLMGVMDFASYMTKHGDDTIHWSIEDWVPQKTIAFAIAPPGSYKTWLTLDLAVSIASGKPFLGHYPVLDPGPVLIVQQEDFHGQIAERIGLITCQRENVQFPTNEDHDRDKEMFEQKLAPNLPIFFHPDRELRFDDENAVAALEQRVSEIKPKFIIIDPLYSAGKVDDYMAKTAEQMLPLKRMRDKYDCSFLLVHHTKKNLENANGREGAWGSQFLNAFLESGWQVRKTDEANDITIKRHFKVKGEVPELVLTFDVQTTRPYRYEIQAGLHQEGDDKKLNIVGALEKTGPMTVGELATELKVHKSTVSRKLKVMIEKGVVTKRDNGKFTLPETPAF